jgi:hypothetical protein
MDTILQRNIEMILKLLYASTLCSGISLALQGHILHSGHFTYRKNISYSDKSLLISEIAPGEDNVILTYCAVECFKNLDCSAVELCSTAAGNTCRLSRAITKSLTSGKDTCSRYELVRYEIG